MIEKKVIKIEVAVTAANDDKNGCLLSVKTFMEGEVTHALNMPAKAPPMFDLDKTVIAVRIAAKLGVLISESLAGMAYPLPSCLQEEALPPEQQGQV